MITVSEATAIIQSNTRDWGMNEVNLDDSLGEILSEDIFADRDFPPFDRVTMDGISIAFEAYVSGIRRFNIENIQAAGEAMKTLRNPQDCMEVMTGAILPKGTDTVIRYEDLDIQDGVASVAVDSVRDKQNVHARGLDRKQGDLIIQHPRKIGPAEIGILATVGKSRVRVKQKPTAAIIGTGDELVGIDENPLPHQIRQSNNRSIESCIKPWVNDSSIYHLLDDPLDLGEKLSDILESYDVLILSGGISKGKYDYIPEVLANLGVQKLFHKVKQRPGKPFWFGIKDEKVVFALPGNPVSSFMCTHRYVIPWLRKSLDLNPMEKNTAILSQDFEFNPELQYFLQVKLSGTQEGIMEASPVKGKGSGDLANLIEADAFLELPMNKSVFRKGEAYPFITWRT